MLKAHGLSKRYGDVVALDGVDLAVEPGEIVGFLGPNGAGKTTTMRAIMQLLELDAGEITWKGGPVDDQVRLRFGYMPAERGMYPRMKVLEHLVYYGQLSGLEADAARAAALEWLERLGLAERADSDVQDLSSGNQQRVQLGLALLREPELLVLDEPFSGLDPVAVETLSDVLRERVARGAALLLSSHQLDLVAEICSSVVIVDAGRVVLRGAVDDLRARADHRIAEVEFATEGDWTPGLAGAVVTAREGRRVVLRTGIEVDADAVLADARGHGAVRSFSFTPPSLSDVFLQTVGRRELDPDGAA